MHAQQDTGFRQLPGQEVEHYHTLQVLLFPFSHRFIRHCHSSACFCCSLVFLNLQINDSSASLASNFFIYFETLTVKLVYLFIPLPTLWIMDVLDKTYFLQSNIILSLLEYGVKLHVRCTAAHGKLHYPADKWDRKCKVDLRIGGLNAPGSIFHVCKLLLIDLVHAVLKVILLTAQVLS